MILDDFFIVFINDTLHTCKVLARLEFVQHLNNGQLSFACNHRIKAFTAVTQAVLLHGDGIGAADASKYLLIDLFNIAGGLFGFGPAKSSCIDTNKAGLEFLDSVHYLFVGHKSTI